MAEQKKKETRPSKPAEGDESGAGSGELAKKGKKLKEDLDNLLDEIDRGSVRDQLSFPVVLWRLGLGYAHLRGERIRSPYLRFTRHR